jgi:hypothetical protein
VSGQWSVVSGQWSVVSGQWSVVCGWSDGQARGGAGPSSGLSADFSPRRSATSNSSSARNRELATGNSQWWVVSACWPSACWPPGMGPGEPLVGDRALAAGDWKRGCTETGDKAEEPDDPPLRRLSSAHLSVSSPDHSPLRRLPSAQVSVSARRPLATHAFSACRQPRCRSRDPTTDH